MKKNLTLVAAGLIFCLMSCKNSECKSSEEIQKNLEVNSKGMKAIETGDAATINSLIADDMVDHMGPDMKETRGGDKVRAMLIDMHNHMKDMKFNVITSAANNEYVFTLSEIKGTTLDATMGVPAGTQMNDKMVDLVKIKDGKIVEHWGFMDPAAMMKQMGNMPMKEMPMNNMNMGEMHMKGQKMEMMPKK